MDSPVQGEEIYNSKKELLALQHSPSNRIITTPTTAMKLHKTSQKILLTQATSKSKLLQREGRNKASFKSSLIKNQLITSNPMIIGTMQSRLDTIR